MPWEQTEHHHTQIYLKMTLNKNSYTLLPRQFSPIYIPRVYRFIFYMDRQKDRSNEISKTVGFKVRIN